MVKTLFTSACLFGAAMLAPAADFYVSTTGRAAGTGSITDPVDWATAMYQAKSPAKPGDTLWVRGGTYRGPFETYLYGQSGKPITVRAYPGERVIVDGVASSTAPTLYIYGLHNIWWGIEVINSSTVRTPGVGRPAGVYMECAGGKLINCIIHDVGLGFGFWTPSVDGEMYGCLVYNVGYEKSDNVGNGHSVYSQNDTGTKKIHDNILCNSFGFGFNIYTEGQQIRGYDLQGNMSFNAGASSISDHRYSNLFVGGYKPSARLNVISNFTYTALGADGAGARFSYGQPDNEDMVCTDNVFVGSDIAFQARYWHTVNVQRNVIYTSPSQTLIWAGPFNVLSGGSVWNNNQYYGVGSRSFQAGESTTSFYDFAGWKSYSGRDQNSTASSGAPTGVRAVVRPNKYEPRRGHVAIYNWDQLDRIAVDVSSVLQPGDRFEIRNAQNFFGAPVLSGTYSGGTILVPTTNLYAAAPTGMSKSNVKPDKTFNTYVIVGQSGPPIANTAPTITAISNQNTPEDSAPGPVSFTVADAETSAGSLLLSAGSSNPTLVPNANITFGGSGGNRTLMVTPAANQNGAADITVTVSDGIATASRTFNVNVSAVNDAPTITAISAQTTSLETPTSPIAFTVGDAETALGSLTITGTSSDQNLVPNSSIVMSGSGANRTVTITPASGQSGTATITLSISDGALAATSAFTLTVTPGNTVPTISDIANRSAGKGQSLAAIPFTVGDGETSPGSLGVTATSANQTLVPNSGLALGGSGANRTLTIMPAAGQTGSVTITLTVTDNALTASDSFTLTITNVIVPPAPLVAHWKFDEGSGSSALDSAGNNHGTLVNAPARTSGVSNGAISFNGTSQYVTVPDANALDVTTNFSVSLWFKPSALLNSSSGRKDLLKKFTSYWLLMNYPDNDGKLSFAFNLGSPVVKSVTTSWAANQWCHTVATYGGGTMKLYVNGVLENSLATSVVPNLNAYALEIGGNSNQDFYFGGAMDDVRLYGGALTAGEISTLYEESKPVPGSNTAPSITAIANQTITAGASTAAIPFTIGDAETAAGSLTLIKDSSRPALIPAANVVLGGSSANRTVTVTPLAGQTGSSTITVIVQDAGGLTASRTFTVTVNAPGSNDVTSGLVGWWKLDEVSGTAATDSSGGGHPGTWRSSTGDPFFTPHWAPAAGRIGGTIELDGVDDFVEVGVFTMPASYTKSAWVKPATAYDPAIVGHQIMSGDSRKYGQSHFFHAAGNSANEFLLGAGHGSNPNLVRDTQPLALGTWYHVVVTYDAATGAMKLYKNGALVGSASGVPQHSDNWLSIGNFGYHAGVDHAQRWRGFIDEARLYNRVLSAGEVAQLAGDITPPANTPPTIANITDKSTTSGLAVGPVSFTIGDSQTAAGSLTLSAASSSVALLPVANIAFGGSGANRTVTLTPANGQTGSSTVTITVADTDGGTATDSFVVTVNPNTPPSVANITDKTALLGQVIGPVSFAVSDAQTAAGSLTLSAASSNPTLVSVANIVFGGDGGTRTITITPANGQTGSSTITVTLTDGQGATESDSFVVTVTAPNTPPTISAIGDQTVDAGTSTEAVAFTVGDGQTPAANLSLSAASSNPSVVPVANVIFGGSGANRTVAITPAANPTGSANITVTVSNGEAAASRTFKVTSKKPAPPKGRVTVRKNGQGAVVPDLDGEELVIGQSYSLKAVPESGNLFAGWEGDVQSAGAALSFVMASNLVLEANFMANPFIPAKGTYNGLFHEADAVRHETSGGFKLKLTDRGTYTASLQMGNRKLPFSGKFKLDGRATNAVHLNKTNVLTIEMSMPDDGSNDPISGRLYNEEWEAELLVDLATFHARTNRAQFAGKYTLVLPSSNEPDAPAGDGFGRVTISAAGVVTLAGTLADGTKVSDSVTLSKAGEWPLYVPLYSGKGSVLGWLTFTNLDETDIAGVLSWIRPAQPKAKFYTNGFAVQTEVVGSHYAAPESKTNRLIQIEAGTVTLTDGGLAELLVNAISIAPNNKVTNLGTNKLSLIFTASTGLFTGKVVNPETQKKLTFQGAVLQKQNLGAGFFLGTEGSGRLVLE